MHPYKLEGVSYSGLSINQCMLRFGPIITNSIRNFKVVEKSLGGSWKWHLNTPIWGNKNFISGNKPFESTSWSAKGVSNLGDLFDPRGMLSFQTLCSLFNLPTTSHFLYLRLWSALRACGVQTNSELQTHPVIDWLSTTNSRGLVSVLYSRLQTQTQKELHLAKA